MKTDPLITNPHTLETFPMSVWVDKYIIGSEGGSAWVWIGDDPNDLVGYMRSGKTRQEAVDKLLNYLWNNKEV